MTSYTRTVPSQTDTGSDTYAYDSDGNPVTHDEFLAADPVLATMYSNDVVALREPDETAVFTAEWRLPGNRLGLWTWIGDEVRSYRTRHDAIVGHSLALRDAENDVHQARRERSCHRRTGHRFTEWHHADTPDAEVVRICLNCNRVETPLDPNDVETT